MYKKKYIQTLFEFGILSCLSVLLIGCASMHTESWQKDLASGREQGNLAQRFNINWTRMHFMSFDNSADVKSFRILDGDWAIQDGKLWAIGGKGNRTIFLCRQTADSVRVEFDVVSHESDGKLGDVTVLLNSVPEKMAAVHYFSSGYALTTASYWNTCTTFYKKGHALARTEYSPLMPGVKNHVIVEYHRGHIRYWLNNAIVLEAWDESPLALDSNRWIGIRTWETKMCIDNVSIFSRTRERPALRENK